MRVTDLRTKAVVVPLPEPLRTAIHDIRSVGCVLVFLDTDAGVTGEAYTFSLSAVRLDVMEAMVESFRSLVIGVDPREVERLFDLMWRDVNFFGHKGISIFALSAIDTACWDIIGKAAEQPVYQLMGGRRTRVKAYASGGLWLSRDTDALVAEAKSFLAQGFRAMKIRLGKPSIEEDVARVAAVRDVIGPEVDLMADANQGLTVSHAIRLGRRLEQYNLAWFEEPVPYYDLAGHAAVAAALDTPIASGETEYTRYGMRDMLEAKAADILMPDLQRVGGLTEFRRVADLASAYEVEVSPHIFTEQSLSIAGAVPNINYVEHMPWFEPLYRERMVIDNGDILIPGRPGLGFSFDPEAIQRYQR